MDERSHDRPRGHRAKDHTVHDLSPQPGDLDPIETAPVEELRALQLERLQWSVRHAYDHVPRSSRV
jgi:phenylacetate-CoA ligase